MTENVCNTPALSFSVQGNKPALQQASGKIGSRLPRPTMRPQPLSLRKPNTTPVFAPAKPVVENPKHISQLAATHSTLNSLNSSQTLPTFLASSSSISQPQSSGQVAAKPLTHDDNEVEMKLRAAADEFDYNMSHDLGTFLDDCLGEFICRCVQFNIHIEMKGLFFFLLVAVSDHDNVFKALLGARKAQTQQRSQEKNTYVFFFSAFFLPCGRI
jgi:hypothetical protein